MKVKLYDTHNGVEKGIKNLIISALKSLIMIVFCVSFGMLCVLFGAWLNTIN